MAGRDPEEEHRGSTPLELLFDLTFVVAVARAAGELHHALADAHAAHAMAGYVMVFFGIWWAWMNFTWFASAYDTDDVPYRLLTLLQMSGVLIYAAGIPAAFERFDFTAVVIGYVVMRIALVTQWLRAAREHPAARSGTVRYAVGVGVVQVAWVAWLLWVPAEGEVWGFAALAVAELAVPVWAERSGTMTGWHSGHITERYGLFTIIVLGEVVLATTSAVQSAVTSHEGAVSAEVTLTAVAGVLLVFGLWWSYFKHSAEGRLRRRSLASAISWGYGHYALFAAVAALGAGLQVVIDTLGHHSQLTPVSAALTVAAPVAVFLVVLGLLNIGTPQPAPKSLPTVIATAVLVVAAAFTAKVAALPVSVLIMAVLVALLLAFHLVAVHRAALR
jgi:low temperature requirement protein LtrA